MALGMTVPLVRGLTTLIVVSLAACSPTHQVPSPASGTTRPSPTATSPLETSPSASRQTALPSPSAPPMGTAPEGCPGPGPRPQTVADFIGPVAFGPPLWAGVYASYDEATNAYAAADAPPTEHGWRIKVLFLLEPGHASTVELVGQGVAGTSGAVLFAIEGTDPSQTAVFDPTNPAVPEQHEGWREYPSYVYFPTPGCFRLTATWPAGSSQLGFGMGGG